MREAVIVTRRVRDVGEFGLIDRVTARLTGSGDVVLGPGDDGAVVAAPDGRVVVTTDVLIEGRHFRRDWSSAADVGHKAAAQNLADVAAMGARPTALVVGFGAPGDLEAEWAEQLAAALAAEASAAGAAVVGGDMTAAPAIVVAVTALGDLEGRPPVRRCGARPGDLVGVAGRLGWSAAGLRLLAAGHRSGPLVAAHRRPAPPYSLGPALAGLGVCAMIDTSDGLVADLGHLAGASSVGIELDVAALRPLAAPGVTDDEMLTGGEDHALAFTISPDIADRVTGLDRCRLVGRVVDGSGVHVPGWTALSGGGHRHWS